MSIPVPLYGFVGGGAALNFAVRAYATEEALLADTPKENTIGVITETEIASYIFSSTEPTEIAEGMLWIVTGTISEVEFNALKKNGIQIYPLGAKLYSSGDWANAKYYIYQNGAWQSFGNVYFFEKNAGHQDLFVGSSRYGSVSCTTGYIQVISKGWKTTDYNATPGASYLTSGDTYDLSDYSTLYFEILPEKINSEVYFGVGTAKFAYKSSDPGYLAPFSAKATVNTTASEKQIVAVDISSLEGAYYIGCETEYKYATTQFSIYNIWATV